MKRILTTLAVATMALFSVSALAASAGNFGIVNMRKVYQSSSQVKQITASLKQKFAGRRDAIVEKGKALQAQIQQFEKNKAVMSKTEATALQKKIAGQELKLRNEQVKFQQDVYTAQNKQMQDFLSKVRGVVKSIADAKKINLVLPASAVVYSSNDIDITAAVIAKLK